MPYSTQSSGAGKVGRAQRPLGFARMALVLGWVAFWLNTALFPCCEVAAAVLGGEADNVSRAISSAQPTHYPDHTQSGSPEQGSDSPCGDTLNPEPPLVTEYEVLTPDRSPLGLFAADAPVATSFTAVNHPTHRALVRPAPPLSLRLYLRTPRLLI